MQLLPTPTILDQGVIAGAEAIHHAVSVLKSQWHAVWNRLPEVVAVEINANPAKSALIMSLTSQAAVANNALLDALVTAAQEDSDTALVTYLQGRFPTRAPNSMPECWSFGVSGFVYTAPPEPEPPAEEPAPE